MKTGAYCFGFLVGLCNTLDCTAPSLLDITHSVHELPSAGQIPRRFVACVDSSPSITSYDSILLRENDNPKCSGVAATLTCRHNIFLSKNPSLNDVNLLVVSHLETSEQRCYLGNL